MKALNYILTKNWKKKKKRKDKKILLKKDKKDIKRWVNKNLGLFLNLFREIKKLN